MTQTAVAEGESVDGSSGDDWLHRAAQVFARIAENPKQYNQLIFGTSSDKIDFAGRRVKEGCAVCFGGHIIAMFSDPDTITNLTQRHVYDQDEAMRLLGVPQKIRKEFRRIFDPPIAYPPQYKRDGEVLPDLVKDRFYSFLATGSMTPQN